MDECLLIPLSIINMPQQTETELLLRLKRFARKRRSHLVSQLGCGFDGLVCSTSRNTAIKAFRFPQLYVNERDVYRRLTQKGVTTVDDFQIPFFKDYDDDLRVIEMTIVEPPYILDFAAARLDQRPHHDPAEWNEAGRELFEHNWKRVKLAIFGLEQYGVFLTDLRPSNINCGEEDDSCEASPGTTPQG